MKKCTICEREVADEIERCPHCGHDFNFHYTGQTCKKQDEKYMTINDEFNQEIRNREKQYEEFGANSIKISKIKNISKDNNEKVYKLEVRNRDYIINWFVGSVVMFFLLNMILFIKISNKIYRIINFSSAGGCLLVFVIALICNRNRISKIIQDIEHIFVYLSLGIQFSLVFIAVDIDTYGFCLWDKYIVAAVISLIVGIVLAALYIKIIDRVYPLFLFIPRIVAPIAITCSCFKAILRKTSFDDVLAPIVFGLIMVIVGGFISTLFGDIRKKSPSVNRNENIV